MAKVNLEDDFYTVAEVAIKLGLAERTVLDKIRAGTLPAVKKWGQWYCMKSDLLEMLAEAKNTIKK